MKAVRKRFANSRTATRDQDRVAAGLHFHAPF
jgi:hypothetical protein